MTDGELFNLFEIDQNGTKVNYTRVTSNMCPDSVVDSIRSSIINQSNKTSLKITVTNVAALPENMINDQTNLEWLEIIGYNLTNVSTNMFSNLTKLKKL